MLSPIRHFFRTLILGDDQFILSHVQYKRILLTGQLCFITIVICLIYAGVDLFSGRPFAWPFQLGCAAIAFASFQLNRIRRFSAAKILLGITVNVTIFLFASSEPIETGLYMYFTTISLGALVSFGYEERYKAAIFIAISTVLFLICLYYPMQIIPRTNINPAYVRFNVLMNFIGSGWTSVCILYFLVSITHRWEAALQKNEKEIKQKNKDLTNLNSSLDRFVYSTSHDLRSPLSSIKGLIQLTQMTSDPKEVKNLIGEMKTQIEHLEKFILDIADYSRNRSQDVITQPVHVKRLLLECLESLRYFPGASDILLHVEVDEDLVVVVDQTRLQVVMNNLLSNAIKYRDITKEKSFIIIRMEFIAGSLLLAVEDNGIGIPPEYVNKIFDMYVRAHEHSQGTGLGLYILKETVERLKGKIEVESQVQLGTSFTIMIPVIRVAADDAAQIESLPA